MQTVSTVKQVRSIVSGWKQQGLQVSLVPTMGNLHAGHLGLVRMAANQSDRVVVSIFVNPTQFGEDEDFNEYPRSLQQDCDQLTELNTDLVFTPTVEEMYPGGIEHCTRVEVPALSHILCGASRPGHFTGVATVVNRLFNMVQPQLAVFGEKDYQQLLVIRRMVRDLAMPVQVLGAPIARNPDGLAMSSRNQYLEPEQRAIAPVIYRTLQQAAAQLRNGNRDYAALEQSGMEQMQAAGLQPEYVSIRRAEDLMAPAATEAKLVILAAAWLGQARLIDNIQLTP
jgi:pantoate--beta-alanine ligase